MPKPSQSRRRRTAGHSNRPRLLVERLEDRQLLASFCVTNTMDYLPGSMVIPGSLRAAITCSNSTSGLNTISFKIGNGGFQTISLTSPLPPITNPVVIDGTTQMGYSDEPLILIDGTGLTGDGLDLEAGSAGSTIKGLNIEDFTIPIASETPLGGIHINSSDNLIEENTLQIDQNGVLVGSATGNQAAFNNTIGATTAANGNDIRKNLQNGILIGPGGMGMNVVMGNTIAQNEGNGIEVSNVNNNIIGGTVTGARNFIFGNIQDGILITGDFASGNSVEGNWIGTDPTGAGAFGNTKNGIEIDAGGPDTIGGTSVEAQNVISGNLEDGVLISSFEHDFLVEGNYIGTDASGMTALHKQAVGVDIVSGAYDTVAGNLISGNQGDGISLSANASNNKILGNSIGTDKNGNGSLGNGGNGIEIIAGSSNTIGGPNYVNPDGTVTRTLGNIISGNTGNGISISGNFPPSTAGNTVQGNFIGTDATGTKALGNGGNGLEIDGGKPNTIGGTSNTIGGTTPAERNVISGNDEDGILISSSHTSGNLVEGNLIGTNLTGACPIPNKDNGVEIDSSNSNKIGGTTATARNVISGNGNDGVLIGAGSKNVVAGNYIGTNLVGIAPIGGIPANDPRGNVGNGVEITSGAGNTIGGTSDIIDGTIAGAGNLISGNEAAGVLIETQSDSNTVQGNFIGTKASGLEAVPNSGDGIQLSMTSNNLIGGPNDVDAAGNVARTLGNVISGNYGSGISFNNSSTGNDIEGNWIGTDASGLHALPNTNTPTAGNPPTHPGNLGYGIDMSKAYSNTIGGTTAACRNVISGNAGSGIFFAIDTNGNMILGNFIGTDTLGQNAIGNGGDGIGSSLSAMNNTIGGAQSGAGNVISGNGGNGISLTAGATGNQILGNLIGTVASGLSQLPNALDGVNLEGATNNIIGGPNPVNDDNVTRTAGNVISGNSGNGISLTAGATGNAILGNFIGTVESGSSLLHNGLNGVTLAGAANNSIGGSNLVNANGAITQMAGNVISGNLEDGISLTAGATGNQILGNLIGTNALGTTALANGTDGVNLAGAGATGNTIGGLNQLNADGTVTRTAGNVISGNADSGVDLATGATANLVEGNYIGTDFSGEFALPNVNGILINAASSNIVGGITPSAANVISGNISIGVQISNSTASANKVMGNLIGVDQAGNATLLPPNANLASGFPIGVFINDSPGNVIGGLNQVNADGSVTRTAGNVISDFGVAVYVSGSNASGNANQAGNAIIGNSIGTNRSGDVLPDSVGVGVYINGTAQCTVGGSTPEARNTILGYSSYGVFIYGSLATRNVVEGNRIGLQTKTGQLAAVAIQGASQNTVAGNTITGNHDAGVYIFGKANSANGNVISANQFQRNLYGVLLYNAPNNGTYSTLVNKNGFVRNQIAKVREFTGAVPKSGQKAGHHAVRTLRRSSLAHPARATGHRHP